MKLNSKNIIGWLRLILALDILDEENAKAITKYISRTDTIRRQKELDKIFGGENG